MQVNTEVSLNKKSYTDHVSRKVGVSIFTHKISYMFSPQAFWENRGGFEKKFKRKVNDTLHYADIS